jgi:hypothetical protein
MLLTAAKWALGCGGGIVGQVTPLSAPLSHATDAQVAEWKSGVLERSQSECRRVLWQIEGETLGDAIAIYEHGYAPDDCLALLPTGEIVEGIPYGGLYIGFGGTFGGGSDTPDTANGFSENTCGVNFPGLCMIYITDTPLPILWPSRQGCGYSPAEIDKVALLLRERPRKTLGSGHIVACYLSW